MALPQASSFAIACFAEAELKSDASAASAGPAFWMLYLYFARIVFSLVKSTYSSCRLGLMSDGATATTAEKSCPSLV